MAARVLAALLFVFLLGVFIAGPVLRSDEASPTIVPEDDATSATPEPTPSSEATEDPGRGLQVASTTKRLATRYPRSCLRPVARPRGDGLIAASNGKRVRIATADGDSVGSFRSEPPVRWSPSGRYLAAGSPGLLWSARGNIVLHPNQEFQHGLVQDSEGAWAWSPVADCGVAIEGDGSLWATIVDDAYITPLVQRDVEMFSFSPDGTRLGVVLERDGRRSMWIVDLAKGTRHLVRRFTPDVARVAFGGWTPEGRGLLYWAIPGGSKGKAALLRSVDIQGRVDRWGNTVVSKHALARCGTRLLGLLEANPGVRTRLASLRRNKDPIRLSGPRVQSAITCSPNDRFIVADRGGRLVLLGRRGDFIGTMTVVETPNGQWSESLPEWGSVGTGVVFMRSMHLVTFVSYVPEGGDARLVLQVRFPASPGAAFDWSATPPDGLPGG
jgi:hypothetical protein